ncbi:MAG: hypothetical protein ACR2F1_06340 [Nitrososphaeraceae archaeon]
MTIKYIKLLNQYSKSIIKIMDSNLRLPLSNIANEKDERLGLV